MFTLGNFAYFVLYETTRRTNLSTRKIQKFVSFLVYYFKFINQNYHFLLNMLCFKHAAAIRFFQRFIYIYILIRAYILIISGSEWRSFPDISFRLYRFKALRPETQDKNNEKLYEIFNKTLFSLAEAYRFSQIRSFCGLVRWLSALWL